MRFPGYGRSVAVLSKEQFDAIESGAAASGEHAAAARTMTELAATGTESESMPRAEAFVRAGEQWLLADDPVEAISDFRRALADGGPVDVDPRVHLSRALFELGKMAEAQEILSRLRAEGPADPRSCDLVAELLVERADLASALDWATAGVELCLAAAPDRQRPAVPTANCASCSGCATASATTSVCPRTTTTRCSTRPSVAAARCDRRAQPGQGPSPANPLWRSSALT